MLKIYNTASRKVEVFKPMTDVVRWYACGPTVYDFAHIGNFRTYIVEDVLRRWLSVSGYKLMHVMNITDVDDKTIAAAQKMGVSLFEYTDYYFHAFLKDMAPLNILAPNIFTKATDHIPDMIALIETLLSKDYAYKSEDGSVYFSIKKFKKYGELAQLEKNQLKAGARVSQDEYSKDNPGDFALWKAWMEEDGPVFWPAPFGKGRPGWHIECSAMSMKYLGAHFDLHAGGVDHIFPHHPNEIAQSEAATGQQFVNYWFHVEHLHVDGHKMSKSLGNILTTRDLITQGYHPMAFRLLVLGAHYRHIVNFTIDSLQGAQNTLLKLYDDVKRFKDYESGFPVDEQLTSKIEQARTDFQTVMNDDLDTPKALAVFFNLIRVGNQAISKKPVSTAYLVETIFYFDSVFGLRLREAGMVDLIPEEVRKLVAKRDQFRAKGRFDEADLARMEIEVLGYLVEDTPMGSRLMKKR